MSILSPVFEGSTVKERRVAYLFSETADRDDLVVLCPEEFNPSSIWYKYAEKLLPYAGKVFWKGDGNESTDELSKRAGQVRCLRAVLEGNDFAGREDKLSVAAWMLSIMCKEIPSFHAKQIWLLR